jgi:alkylation response protein AidB-like acyl-CoA dehydrogenase
MSGRQPPHQPVVSGAGDAVIDRRQQRRLPVGEQAQRFRHPLSRLPRVQEKVGQIAGLLLVNRSLLEQAAAPRPVSHLTSQW